MFSRTSGGTDGLAANWDSGSPGASDSTAYSTKLINSSVGIAVSSRRTRYRDIQRSTSLGPLGGTPRPLRGSTPPPRPPPPKIGGGGVNRRGFTPPLPETGSGGAGGVWVDRPSGRGVRHRGDRAQASMLAAGLGPVSDVPEHRVPRVGLDALELLALAIGGLRAGHQRDQHGIPNQDIVHLDGDLVALVLIALRLVLLVQIVVLRVGIAAVIAAVPLVRLLGDLLRGPTFQVVGLIRAGRAVGVHLDIGVEVRRRIRVAGVAAEEDAGVGRLQLDLGADLFPARLDDVLLLLAQRVDRRLIQHVQAHAVLGAHAV